MTFRVIKFCKHSPGGLTVISNLFHCSFPSSLYPPLISLHISLTYLPTFTFALPASSVNQPFRYMPLFSLTFSSFLFFFLSVSLAHFCSVIICHFGPLLFASFMLIVMFGAAVHWWISATLNPVRRSQICPLILLSPLSALFYFILCNRTNNLHLSSPLVPLLTFIIICVLPAQLSLLIVTENLPTLPPLFIHSS